MSMSVADFFCGAGGFSEGFRQAGFNVEFALDIWGPAIDTHELNHPECDHAKMDIRELKTPELIDAIVPDTEIIIGSPPCVSFSGSNKAGKADKTLGMELIEAYLRIVAWKKNKPGSILRYWVMENVPNSAKHTKEKYTFGELGLKGGRKVALRLSQRHILNAAHYGAPQTRTRFFGGEYPAPEIEFDESDWVTMRTVMKGLRDPLTGRRAKTVVDPLYQVKIPRNELTDHFYDTTVNEFEWKKAKRLKQDHGFMGRMSFPEDLDRPSRTVMATRSASTREAMLYGANKDDDGHWGTYRLPTIREVATMMSFPITYQFQSNSEAGKYRLVGNAVCPLMGRAIARSIAEDAGLPEIDGFIPLDNEPPGTDLTGMKFVPKDARPRRPDARFSHHIPGTKVRGLRVDLTNRFSDHAKGKVRWDAVLHEGVGKNANLVKVPLSRIRKALSGTLFSDLSALIHAVDEDLPFDLSDARSFQRIYCRLEHGTGPDEVLEELGRLLERHLPVAEYRGQVVGQMRDALGLDRKDEVPVRVLAGLYAASSIADRINRRASCE